VDEGGGAWIGIEEAQSPGVVGKAQVSDHTALFRQFPSQAMGGEPIAVLVLIGTGGEKEDLHVRSTAPG